MTQSAQKTNLAHALSLAAQCLADVESGRSLSAVLYKLEGPNRPAALALVSHALRFWGLGRTWRSMALSKRASSAALNSLVGLSLLMLDVAMQKGEGSAEAASVPSHQSPLSSDAPVYPVHTIVDQSVRAARLLISAPFAPRLMNAILRRFQRERVTFVEAVTNDPVARYGYPVWWQKRVQQAYPAQWEAILSVSRHKPALVLRVNTRVTTLQTVIEAMQAQNLEAQALTEVALSVRNAGAVESLPGYDAGWWSVQDLSAQRAAQILAPFDGAKVLDACAAPGGKSSHLLELAQIELTAVDADARRLEMTKQNLSRLQLMDPDCVHLIHADVRKSQSWRANGPYDLILADVPCTASGIVRRHPDIPWLRRESDLKQTTHLQREILDALWSSLKPGGRLLLATCSVFEEEGEQQAQAFLSRFADAKRQPAPGQILPMAAGEQHATGFDGFFYALFEKGI